MQWVKKKKEKKLKSKKLAFIFSKKNKLNFLIFFLIFFVMKINLSLYLNLFIFTLKIYVNFVAVLSCIIPSKYFIVDYNMSPIRYWK